MTTKRMDLRGRGALLAALLLTQVPAAGADDPLLAAARAIMAEAAERGVWRNPWMTTGTGEESSSASGDALLDAHVAAYSRAALDRGGWLNPYAPSDGYASGNALLAVLPGAGFTGGK